MEPHGTRTTCNRRGTVSREAGKTNSETMAAMTRIANSRLSLRFLAPFKTKSLVTKPRDQHSLRHGYKYKSIVVEEEYACVHGLPIQPEPGVYLVRNPGWKVREDGGIGRFSKERRKWESRLVRR